MKKQPKKKEQPEPKNVSKFNGDMLKKYRVKNGFKNTRRLATEICKRTGVDLTAQSIQNHERGVHEPKMTYVLIYADFFGVKPHLFYMHDDDGQEAIAS